MAWMMDTFSMHMRQTVTAVVTGKPLNIGGSRGRREATGRGVLIVCDEALKKLGMQREGTRVIVQGFGNVGSMPRSSCMKRDTRSSAFAEYDGGLYNASGIDINKLVEYRQRNGTVVGFPERNLPIQGTHPQGVRNPGAMRDRERDHQQKTLTESGEDHRRGANGPPPPLRMRSFRQEGLHHSDILANAGGVTASYFEWVQDRQGYFWKESVVNEQLENILVDSFDSVVQYADTHGVNNRIAAYMLAIDRVAFTIKQRGVYA